MIKIAAVSDLHGILPEIPEVDLLLIAGDICPLQDHSLSFQRDWLDWNFRHWLRDVPAKKIVGCAGNHDFIWQDRPGEVPKGLPWTYLQDRETEYEGLKIWGTPHQPVFGWWAFNLLEEDLVRKWELIPKNADIIVLHGPPYGYGDQAPRYNAQGFENTGSPSLTAKILEIKPKLVVCGHIHEAHGQWNVNGTIIANVSIVNGKYQHVHKPTIFEI